MKFLYLFSEGYEYLEWNGNNKNQEPILFPECKVQWLKGIEKK